MKKLLSLFALLIVSALINAQNYLCFTANEDSSSVGMYTESDSIQSKIQYSIDGGKEWRKLEFSNMIPLRKGERVYFKGDYPQGLSSHFNLYVYFKMSGSIAASGSVMSLIDGKGVTTKIPSPYCFYGLFRECSSLTTAPSLPATELADDCYHSMFEGCEKLNY